MCRYSHFWGLVAVLTGVFACSPQPKLPATLSSPDGHIGLTFSLTEEGAPRYAVTVNGKPFIETSALGLEADGVNLADGFHVTRIKRASVDESWTQAWGENKQLRDCHRGMTVHLNGAEGQNLALEFRLFDDGFGFRYIVQTEKDTLLLRGEKSEFRFAGEGMSWSIPGDFNSYEHLYRKLPLSEVQDANTPITVKFADDLYASVHEAAIYDYPEMVLRNIGETAFQSALAPLSMQPGAPCAILDDDFSTPWRTVQISPSAVGLVNSALILNLNEPCKIADVSWIKPMKYVGVWWGMHLGIESWGGDKYHGATTEAALRYIDFAAENNIQGVLFEGWNDAWRGSEALPDFDFTKAAPDFDIEKVLSYAREKGIAFISHNETGGNFRRFEEQLERSFEWLESNGVHALKTGYAGGGLHGGIPRHSQTGVSHFQKVVEEAAEKHIMIDAHETIKASGIRRTWPNFMTRECGRGMEYNGWSEGNPPSHHEVLPYTRLLGGPMDYTPGVFDVEYRSIEGKPQVRDWGQPGTECRVNTTLCKQIANWVVLYSPLQMACDLLENYEGHPAFQFFRDFDADCDASEALQGEVGEWIAVVRRCGNRYFYGATTDESAREITQPLSFLEEGVSYDAVIYADAADASWESNPYAYTITRQTVTKGDTLMFRLATSGGVAVSFIPAP